MRSAPMKRLTDRQRDLVALMRASGQLAVFGSDERIDDWKSLKDVMVTLGGAWKRGSKARPGGFLFPDDIDVQETLRLAHETGEILDPKAAGFFETQPPLVARVIELLGDKWNHAPWKGSRFLEPSAGRGAIALALAKAFPSATIVCIELLRENAEALQKRSDEARAMLGISWGDFLRVLPDDAVWFEAIAMNPPFAGRADVHHITHALRFLRPGGRLVAIASAGIRYREDNLTREFRALLDRHGATIEDNPDGSFAAAGTMVRTVTIALTKQS